MNNSKLRGMINTKNVRLLEILETMKALHGIDVANTVYTVTQVAGEFSKALSMAMILKMPGDIFEQFVEEQTRILKNVIILAALTMPEAIREDVCKTLARVCIDELDFAKNSMVQS